jgi:glycosyltransferase involved in cell wall biosynthesis
MKIAQIVASLEARHGGPSRSVRGLSAAFAAAGHQVELLTTAPGGAPAETPAPNFVIHTFPRQWPARLVPSAPMRAHLRTVRFDVVHHHGLWLRPLHYAHLAAARSGSPLIVSPRGMMAPWAWSHRRWKKVLAGYFVHPGAVAAVRGWHATSETEAGDIRRLGFRQPVCVAPNGVAPPAAAEVTAAKEFWRRLCPDLAGRPAALFYSRFHPMKRVIELIDVWLDQAPPGWLLLLVGIPEKFSVRALRAYVYRAGGEERVAVFDGTDRPPPYAAAELLLLPSHSENFGLVVAEALSHGLPVLATDTTPWHGLDDRGAGRCVAWADFGSALVMLLGEGPDGLRARADAARAWAGEEFAWDKSTATLTAFYEGLSARPA